MTDDRPSSPLRAFLWIIGAAISFVAMAVSGREIQHEFDTFELMLYRSVIGFLILAPVIGTSRAGFAQIRTRQIGLHALRNVFHYAGQNAWFLGVATIPLAQVIALEMTNPIWVALLAPFLLGEVLTRWRLIAAILGFAGILIIARPGIAPLEMGHLFAFAASVCFALTTITTRKITRTDTVLSVLFWMTLMQGVMSLALSLPGGFPIPSPALVPWVIVAGLTGLSAHFCLASALNAAPTMVVAPMEFIRLPMTALAGMWIYGEPLEVAVFVGGAVIVTGILLNIRAERNRARAL